METLLTALTSSRWPIILWIAMFIFLVIIHELWHFFAAKWAGVHVHEFGIWIPPKAKTVATDSKWTEYTLNWLPLGWFVRLKWEDPEHASFLEHDSFIVAPLFKKLVILLGWVIVNAVFARLAFSFAFMAGTTPITILPDAALDYQSESYLLPSQSVLYERAWINPEADQLPATVVRVMDESIAAELWVQEDDIIRSINWTDVYSSTLWSVLQESINKPLRVVVDRSGQEVELTGQCPESQCVLWVAVASALDTIPEIKFSGWEAFTAWGKEFMEQSRLTFHTLWTLFANLFSWDKERIEESTDWLSWPVGIVAFWKELFLAKWRVGFLAFAWMISLALAVFNILPIPALDGWRIVSVLIQSLSNFKAEKYFIVESYVNVVFFGLLMLIGLYVIYQDILRII